VPRPPYPRNVADFNRMFPDACVAYLATCRWPDGFRCPRCGEHEAFDLPRRRLWQCKSCGHQTSVTAGTVMHRTRTPLMTWFWAAFWMTAHKPGLSALQLQHMLGLARYETAWLILHKLRRAMVDANREPLKGTVEIDETFIGGEQLGLRGGRQLAGRKALMIAIAVEVRGKGPGRVRAEVIPDATAPSLSHFIVANIELGSTVLSDGHRGYQGTEDVVPHAHRAISNLKAWLLGTHRGVGADQLPVYLDEFVFRWNRRHAPMAGFQTLLGLGTHREPTTYEAILGKPPMTGKPRHKGRKTGLTLSP
jgi:transposase-like protein